MVKIKIPIKKQKADIIDCKSIATGIKAFVKTEMIAGQTYTLNIFAPNTPDNAAFIKGIKKDAAELGIDVNELSTENWDVYVNEAPYIVMYDKKCGMAYDELYDVDAYNPLSGWDSCTGEAVEFILKRLPGTWNTETMGAGTQIAVVGRGDTGTSVVDTLRYNTNATLIQCNSTSDLCKDLKNADVIVSCAGKANLITKKMVKKGAIVIDVGVNVIDGKIVGDVSEEVKKVAKYVTAVPNGIGLVTRAMLMCHVVEAINEAQK